MVAPGRGVRTGLHLTDFGAHDPWIYADADNKTYYLYVSGRGYGRTGTAFYKSTDLLSWDGPYLAFLVPDGTWANPQTSAWAPEVHFYKGKYYLFTTLHNPDKIISPGLMGGHPRNMRSTIIAVSDSPEGPFRMLKADAPTAPADFMTLDGTFFVDPDGHPWMVYAHEWVQKVDGTIEALPLKDDLSDASGPPIYLFKASDAPWIDQMATPTADENHYVSDGPEMWRTKDGHLLMLWSSYQRVDPDHDVYVETLARSTTGKLQGPWEQLPVLVGNDSGHGMLFHTFDGRLLLVVLQPFNGAHAKIYEVDDSGDHLVLGKYREDLSGPPLGPQSGQPVQ
jgi:beta-xylosidase